MLFIPLFPCQVIVKPLLLLVFCVLTFGLQGQIFEVNSAARYETVVTGINIPWGIDFLPNGEMLVTEKTGKLYRVVGDRKNEIKNVPEVIASGQGGLLDVRVHPEYEQNGWIYFSYSKGGEGQRKGLATTAIFRAKLVNDELQSIQEIFEAHPYSGTRHHYGCRMVFKDGYIYFSVGDRGDHDRNPQSLRNHCGKIHRVNDDGSIPSDNPFANSPVAMPTIFSYGHRNPQGLAVNPASNTLWEHEHGPMGGDEINLPQPAKNYGWPVITYGIDYDGTKISDISAKEGMEQPEIYWVPSIAPSGMEFISSNRYGDWNGNLLVGSLKFSYLHMCIMKNGKVIKQEKLLNGIGRVRSIRQGPDGFIYVGVEGKGIVRLRRD